MAVIHQKSDAMLFGLYGKRFGEVNDLKRGHLYFVPTRSPRFRTRDAGDRQGGFLGQVTREAELFFPQSPLAQNGLYLSGPVPKRQKLEFAARSMMADPPPETNFLPDHFSNPRDRHNWDTHTTVYAFTKPWSNTRNSTVALSLVGERGQPAN